MVESHTNTELTVAVDNHADGIADPHGEKEEAADHGPVWDVPIWEVPRSTPSLLSRWILV
jgi:hypothetical protein